MPNRHDSAHYPSADQVPAQSKEGLRADKRPRRRLRKWCVRVVLVVALLGVGMVGVVIWLSRSTPQHWQEHQAFLESTTPQEREAIAQRAEQRLLDLLDASAKVNTGTPDGFRPNGSGGVDADDARVKKRTLPDGTVEWVREMSLTEREANALMIQRYKEWMKQRGYVVPNGVGDPMVKLESDGMLMAFAYRHGGVEQVFSLRFGLRFQKNGKARLALHEVFAGELPIPTDAIGSTLRRAAPDNPDVAKAADWLEKLKDLEFRPLFKIDDAHKATVEGYKLKGKGIALKLRVRQRPVPAASIKDTAIVSVPTP